MSKNAIAGDSWIQCLVPCLEHRIQHDQLIHLTGCHVPRSYSALIWPLIYRIEADKKRIEELEREIAKHE